VSGDETVERVRGAVKEVFDLLDDSFESANEYLDFRPDYAGAWSVLEHLEHVSLANHFLLLTIRKGCRIAVRRAAGGQLPEGESDLEPLDTLAIPGAFEWNPPVHMIPTGGRAAAEVRAELKAQREECLELLGAMTRGEGRLYSIRMSVNKLGRLDMYQWLYFLAQHARYHVAWVEKLKEGLERA
jgi:hypothetical protein